MRRKGVGNVGTSEGNAFVLPVPANWDPIIDSMAVRRHKINYKEEQL